MPDHRRPLRSSDWAAMAIDAEQVGQSLLTLLWLARGLSLAAGSEESRKAASGALDVVNGAMERHRSVVQFIEYGRGLAEEAEHAAVMDGDAEKGASK